MSRLSYKQLTEKTADIARRLGIDGYLHLAASNGYYQLQIYVNDNNGQKTSAVNTLTSGTLAEISAYLNGQALSRQAERVAVKLPQSWPNIRSIAVGSLTDALGDKWRGISDAQAQKMENFLASEIHNALNYGEELITKDDYLNLIRDSYAYATKTTIVIKD